MTIQSKKPTRRCHSAIVSAMSASVAPGPLTNRLRYRHLMLLRKLGELGNLHRAAEAISLTQPSASKMLRSRVVQDA